MSTPIPPEFNRAWPLTPAPSPDLDAKDPSFYLFRLPAPLGATFGVDGFSLTLEYGPTAAFFGFSLITQDTATTLAHLTARGTGRACGEWSTAASGPDGAWTPLVPVPVELPLFTPGTTLCLLGCFEVDGLVLRLDHTSFRLPYPRPVPADTPLALKVYRMSDCRKWASKDLVCRNAFVGGLRIPLRADAHIVAARPPPPAGCAVTLELVVGKKEALIALAASFFGTLNVAPPLPPQRFRDSVLRFGFRCLDDAAIFKRVVERDDRFVVRLL